MNTFFQAKRYVFPAVVAVSVELSWCVYATVYFALSTALLPLDSFHLSVSVW